MVSFVWVLLGLVRLISSFFCSSVHLEKIDVVSLDETVDVTRLASTSSRDSRSWLARPDLPPIFSLRINNFHGHAWWSLISCASRIFPLLTKPFSLSRSEISVLSLVFSFLVTSDKKGKLIILGNDGKLNRLERQKRNCPTIQQESSTKSKATNDNHEV